MRPSIALAAFGTLCLIGFAVFFPTEESKVTTKRYVCLSNVKRRALALTVYAEDADGRFPGRERWMDATAVYLRHKPPLCEGEDPDPERSMRCPALFRIDFGYALNAQMSNAKTPQSPETIPLVYDSTNPVRNASDPLLSFPNPGRHESKNNLAYADGHAKSQGQNVGLSGLLPLGGGKGGGPIFERTGGFVRGSTAVAP